MVTPPSPYAAFLFLGFRRDRKSTRLNSSHGYISYAVFCLKKEDNKGELLPTDNITAGIRDDDIKSVIQGSNVPKPDEAVPSFVYGAMAKAGKGLLEGPLQAGSSAVSDKLLDLVGLGGKSAADKGKYTRDYLAAALPQLNAC